MVTWTVKSKQNNSKTLMWKSDSSSTKCPQLTSLSKIGPKPDLDRSFFNKKLQFGIGIGLNISLILFIHHEMSTSPVCETSIFLVFVKTSLANMSERVLSRSNDLKCNGPKHTAGKLLVNLPSCLVFLLMIRNSSWSTSWPNCFMEAFFSFVSKI